MSSAKITSIEALRRFKAALLAFETDVHDAITMLDLEARRPVDWIESDRTFYWPKEMRKATDVLSEARLALERCTLTISGDDHRSCYDERKAYERAKRRLELTEEKIKAVRRWKVRLYKEINDFKVQLAKLKQYMDSDFTSSLVALERMAEALDRYIEQGANLGPAASPSRASSSPSDVPTTDPKPQDQL